MKTFKFHGIGDDTFGEYGVTYDDYDNCASGKPIEWQIDSSEGSLVVVGQYARRDKSGASWTISVEAVRKGKEDPEIPAWPIRIRRGGSGESPYSPTLEVGAPDDATLRCLQREEGGS